MTYEELQKVNLTIKTTDIKGKEYAEVNQRIKAFRKLFPMGCIKTNILSLQDGVVTMTAEVLDENGKLLATGTAQEKETSSFINKTSFVENCETSAIGRALGILGIGIDTSVASYEEVATAIHNQPQGGQEKRTAKGKVSTTPKAEKPIQTATDDSVVFTDDTDREGTIRGLCAVAGKDYAKCLAWVQKRYGVQTLDELTSLAWDEVKAVFEK